MPNESDHLSRPVCVPKSLPKGWRFQELLGCCAPRQWPTLPKSALTPTGYTVYGANGPLGFFPSYTHEKEVIAIGCRGTCGTIQKIPGESYVNGNAMCLDHIRTNIVSPSFLYHALTYRNVSDAVSGSAQPQITRTSLKRVAFPLPPPDEQDAIARLLDVVDTALERTRAAIQQTKKLKFAALQQFFYASLGETAYADRPRKKLPNGWSLAPTEHLLAQEPKNGASPTASSQPPGIPTFSIAAVRVPEILVG